MLQAVDLRNRRTSEGESLSVRVGHLDGRGRRGRRRLLRPSGRRSSAALRQRRRRPGARQRDLSRSLAGRTEIELRVAGDRDLKGLADPVAVWSRRRGSRLARRGRCVRVAGPAGVDDLELFVGRRLELDALAAVVKEASASRGRAVWCLVVGRGGDGQDDAFSPRSLDEVHDDGAVVLYGRADEDLNAPV